MIVRRALLKAALAAATKDDTRYYLNGVQVAPDGTVEATDGHIAVRLRERAPEPAEDMPLVPGFPEGTRELSAPLVLDAELVTRLCGQKDSRTLRLLNYTVIRETVQPAEGCGGDVVPDVVRPVLGQTDLSVPVVVTLPAEERRFPNLERVIPARGGGSPLAVSTEVLDALLKLLKGIQAAGVVFTVPPAVWDDKGRNLGASATVRFAAVGKLGEGVELTGGIAPFMNAVPEEYPTAPTQYSRLPETRAICAGCAGSIRRMEDGDWIDATDQNTCGASYHAPVPSELIEINAALVTLMARHADADEYGTTRIGLAQAIDHLGAARALLGGEPLPAEEDTTVETAPVDCGARGCEGHLRAVPLPLEVE